MNTLDSVVEQILLKINNGLASDVVTKSGLTGDSKVGGESAAGMKP